MTVYSFICYLFTSAQTIVLKIIRRYGQKKKTDKQTNKKEKRKRKNKRRQKRYYNN